MNIAIRKLALLEKSFIEKEENARTQGYSTSPVEKEMCQKVYDLMEKVRLAI